MGHEIVLVLGRDVDVDLRLLRVLQVDVTSMDISRSKNRPSFSAFWRIFVLRRLAQMAVAGGNAHLHVWRSPHIVLGPADCGGRIPLGPNAISPNRRRGAGSCDAGKHPILAGRLRTHKRSKTPVSTRFVAA